MSRSRDCSGCWKSAARVPLSDRSSSLGAMLEQYFVQYDLRGCCLRAPWIMEKDDFRYSLSFGEDVFGGPRWRDLVGAEGADGYLRTGTVPVMLDRDGRTVKRNFVHVSDLVEAILLAL